MSVSINKEKYIEKYINTQVDIKQNIPFGFNSSINQNGQTKIYVKGKRNIEENLPFTADTIYRMASQSKFMGTVAFLKLIDKKLVEFDDPLSKYLPEFANHPGVIKPYSPSLPVKTLMDPLETMEDSNIVRIYHKDHPFKEGDKISLEWSNGSLNVAKTELPSVNGIPGFEVFNIFYIENVKTNEYSVKTSSLANRSGKAGGFIKIRKVPSGTFRSICLSPDTMLINPKVTTHYYQLEPLKRELTVLDVLTHGLGWSYYSSTMLYMSFGYACDPLKKDIQSGIWNELGLPVGLPLSCYKCGIREWVRLSSNIPLLYQPGEDWSYGPQLSVLGALIEVIKKIPVEKYMREELWTPLGMNDTGFFIHDEDPSYNDKVNRLSQLYINMPKIVLKFMGDGILTRFPAIYEAQVCTYTGPRNLCMIDCGMYTTVDDYMKFMLLFLSDDQTILSKEMIKTISTYRTCYDVSNLASVDSYSSNLSAGIGKSKSHIERDSLLMDIKWGLGVGTIKGCKNLCYSSENKKIISEKSEGNEEIAITWAGVLGTRFLIDFCSKVAYNAGTNVIGPPAGTFDMDLIEMDYKEMNKEDYKYILSDLLS